MKQRLPQIQYSVQRNRKVSDMSSICKVIIVGNLGKDPEIRYLPSGEAVATEEAALVD